MPTLRVYKSTMPSCNFIMPDGKPLIFQQGRYYTDVEREISLLDYEVSQRHPHIFIDNEEKVIDSEDLNPLVAMQKKILGRMSREELVAALQAKEAEAVNPANDLGKSDQSAVKPANSQDVAAAAAGGSGIAVTARLANLIKS